MEAHLAERLRWKKIPPGTSDYQVGYRWLKPNGYKSVYGPKKCLFHALAMEGIDGNEIAPLIFSALGIPENYLLRLP